MPPITFPNQRVINIHRETAKTDFLGIKNENWQAAARDLGAHATMLYLYLASNADGYNLALSPAAIQNAIGMPRSTYHDQFRKLLLKGYLVEQSGNRFDFFEVPKTRDENHEKSKAQEQATTDSIFDGFPSVVTPMTESGFPVVGNGIQINNTKNPILRQDFCFGRAEWFR